MSNNIEKIKKALEEAGEWCALFYTLAGSGYTLGYVLTATNTFDHFIKAMAMFVLWPGFIAYDLYNLLHVGLKCLQ